MLLVYSQETDNITPEDYAAIYRGHEAVMKETSQCGVFRAAEPLAKTATATTVRTQNGEVLVTDGPFAETKEQLAGYYILECDNLDDAISWASKIPTGCQGASGCVEIRPIREVRMPGPA